MKITENLQENFPFISVINHTDKEYVGIIINQDAQITSMYVYDLLKSEAEKKMLLDLGEAWWWESNRQIPINIFLSADILPLKYSIRNFNTKDVNVVLGIRNFNTKDVNVVLGPCTSLNDFIVKRVKRKSITLVRKIN